MPQIRYMHQIVCLVRLLHHVSSEDKSSALKASNLVVMKFCDPIKDVCVF